MNMCHVNDECCALLTKCVCYHCTRPVCRPCSIRMLDERFVGLARVCHHCIRETRGPQTDLIIIAHITWLKDAPRSNEQMDKYHPFNKPSFSFTECVFGL